MAQFILNQFEKGVEKNIYRPIAISGSNISLGIADSRHFDLFLTPGLATTIP